MLKRLFKKDAGKETKPAATEAKKPVAKKPASTKGSKPAQSKKPAQNRRKPNNQNKRPRKQKPVEHPPWDISEFQVPEAEGKTRFHDLDLPDQIMRAVQDLGFEYCSPIQGQILPHTLRGLDAIGKAQTGTGKTAAFLITIIDELINNPMIGERYKREPRAVVVAPTRELVLQIAEDAKGLCKFADVHVVTLIGGADYQKQQRAIEQKPVDIVVATPGRLLDFMKRRDIDLKYVECLVLDEADRMLDMGFIPQVRQIVRATPPKEERQTQLFSATFDHDILNLARQWTHDPVHVEVAPEKVATDTVEQHFYMVSKEEKFQVLKNVLKQDDVELAIVFSNRRDWSQKLFDKLRKAGFTAGVLSGEISQQKRQRTLDQFKSGDIKVLVATDVMGRGIHVDGVTHVVNYNLPEDPEDYVHRIGRTGRAGAKGVSVSLACEDDSFQIPTIEKYLGKKLKCELPPEELAV